MAPVRWKDKTDIGTLADSDRMPVTDVDDANTDKYTTPAEISAFVLTGRVIGTDIQAWSANLDGWSAEDPADYSTTAEANALYQPLDSDLTAIAALSTTSFGRGLLESASAAGLFGNIKQTATESATGVSEFSTTAEVRAAGASDDTVIRSRMLRDAAALVTLTDAATVALDWTAGINFTLTLTTNRILGNPSNGIPGTTRTVFVISDGGPDELTFGNQYGGEPPTLDDITTTKGYLLSIYCRTATQFLVTAIDGSPA